MGHALPHRPLTGRMPTIRHNGRTVADFTRVVEQTGTLDRDRRPDAPAYGAERVDDSHARVCAGTEVNRALTLVVPIIWGSCETG